MPQSPIKKISVGRYLPTGFSVDFNGQLADKFRALKVVHICPSGYLSAGQYVADIMLKDKFLACLPEHLSDDTDILRR